MVNGNPSAAPSQKKLHITDKLAHTVVFVTVVHRVSTDPVHPIGVVVGPGVLLVRPGQFVTIGGHEMIVEYDVE